MLNYKEVLEQLDFNFCTKLYKSFKDDLAVYFMEGYDGSLEMFDLLRQKDPFDHDEAKFYIGILILTLEYFNAKGIIHRDLKPENMIIDNNGYLHLKTTLTVKLMKNH